MVDSRCQSLLANGFQDEHRQQKKLLIIFYRNPEFGKVKTRLAATVGDSRALTIYLQLVSHTRTITEEISADVAVYYSHHIDSKDLWNNERYQKHLQYGADLGEKMMHAFETGFKSGYDSICIIGTDCFELTTTDIEEAFVKLHVHDAVLGPAKDGGYYLLGMNELYSQFFQNKTWSTNSVAESTIKDFNILKLDFWQLRELRDVDDESDLPFKI